MQINGIWEVPNADQEVGGRHVGHTKKYQLASSEPMQELAYESWELGKLDDEPMHDLRGEENVPVDDDMSNPMCWSWKVADGTRLLQLLSIHGSKVHRMQW